MSRYVKTPNRLPSPEYVITLADAYEAVVRERDAESALLDQAKEDIITLLAERLPDGITLHRMVTTYPKVHQRLLTSADREIAGLKAERDAAYELVRRLAACHPSAHNSNDLLIRRISDCVEIDERLKLRALLDARTALGNV